ncbi:hypothetical protein CCMA1212_008200 [Trichoderma ghanense]|uniref:Uncharacterized protein n=1 Tax=Trichoderma ghanense TaxID=65468 RepID=A0ABY2GW27_9HYPO
MYSPEEKARKAGPDGTKVTLGQNAPEIQEGTGVVPKESLAAEALKSGSEFAHNRVTKMEEGVSSSSSSSDRKKTQQSGRSGRGGGGDEEDRNGAPAPTYVADVYLTGKGKGGPHGKNIKEGIDESELRGKESDGLQKALRAEPGSEDDPSRLAEVRLLERDSWVPGDKGRRQGGVEGGTKFDKLESDVSLWLRHLFDRFHSRIPIFRESHTSQTDKARHSDKYGRRYADMPSTPEEKSSLRPPRPEVDARQQTSSENAMAGQNRRDVPTSTNVPSEQDVQAQEMEHQRYGEAQPQLVPTDMIEMMLTARGRNKDGLDAA